jgi:hypothetical protein
MDQKTPPAKGAKHIEELLQQIPPESERYQVLVSVRRFKSSWAELGEWLTRVATSGQFQEWGYTSRILPGTAFSMPASSSSVRNAKCDSRFRSERRPLFCRASWINRSMRRSGMSTIS